MLRITLVGNITYTRLLATPPLSKSIKQTWIGILPDL